MSYDSILVHIEFDGNSTARMQYATDMAGDLDAYLIGFSAVATRSAHQRQMALDIDGEPADCDPKFRFAALKRDFFDTAGDGNNSAWRQVEDYPTRALIANACVADLIVSGTPHGAKPLDHWRAIDPATLVCDAGRPVLLVGDQAVFRHPRCAVIGWKARPQARRAVIFALPFLQLAKRTLVLAIGENGEKADLPDDVVRYLSRHGIDAEARTVPARHASETFLETVRALGADLVVAGACGHNPLAERLFGSFTQALLMQADLTRLMAG